MAANPESQDVIPPAGAEIAYDGPQAPAAATVPAAVPAGDGLGCHAGKEELRKAAAAAGKSETLERYARDYPVGPHDVFPEEFATFVLTDARNRETFLRHHAYLLDARWWQDMQRRIAEGLVPEVLSYPDSVRFRH